MNRVTIGLALAILAAPGFAAANPAQSPGSIVAAPQLQRESVGRIVETIRDNAIHALRRADERLRSDGGSATLPAEATAESEVE